MNKMTYKIVLFLFYFLFVISYYELEWINKIRYLGIALIVIIGIISYLIDKKNMKEKNTSFNKVSVILYYLMFITLTVTTLFSNYQINSLFKIISLFVLFIIVFFILPHIINKIGLITHNFLLIYSILLGIGIAFLISPDGHIVSYGARVTTFETRLKLFFYHPNILGSMCFIAIAFFQLNYVLRTKKISITNKLLHLFIIVILIYILYLTNSRTPLYSLIILQVIIFYRKYLNTFYKKLTIYALCIAAIPLYINQVLNMSYEELNILLSDRLYLWNQALNQLLFENKILTGVGSYLNSQLDSLDLVLIDNGYIYIMYQNGVVALIILLILSVNTLWSTFRIKVADKIKNYFLSLFTVYLFIGFFENSLFNISNLVCITILSTTYYVNKYHAINI
ncbi:O-antigen ligase family protein [Exiguobacterium sp. BRG2]|uniref:O-antigen ligase family protein n=1 Tax=Exiguobacterium sp. BRG2 TaxID=2962584 RepID=UPI0028810729|nr:O-antigen ligase family protein [Exiguobacterium sp. BRG2]MDT0172777.1 O-antigen ligase family protein [Exiguobacterium sp. BRG2]